MTKRTITRWFVAAMLFFGSMFVLGVVISIFDNSPGRVVFGTYKDLLPLLIAIVAAWLGFCVQRRSAYLQQLRALWSKLVESIQFASQYTHKKNPDQDAYSTALFKLSVVIDEIRGLFCNLTYKKHGDLFPFEPLKDIYQLIADLGYGEDFQAEQASETRDKIFLHWKQVRSELLKEFDREVPTWPVSRWQTK